MSAELIKAVLNGDAAAVDALLRARTPADGNFDILAVKVAEGNTALHLAAQTGRFEICQTLLSHDAPLEEQNEQGLSPLYLAAIHGHADIVTLLLSAGANPNTHDGQEATALQRACEAKLETVASAFASNPNTQIDHQDLLGRSALHWCASNGLVKVASLLIGRGAKVLKTKGGETPLHRAARAGQETMVRLLLARFPDFSIFTRNEREETVLDVAETENIKDILKAHATSHGQIDTGSQKIDTTPSSVAVKKLTPLGGGGAAKKLTINLKK